MRQRRRRPGPVCLYGAALAVGLAMSVAAPAVAAETDTDAGANAYRACQTHDEAAFRAAIEAITKRALTAGLARLDYEAVVRTEWRKRDLDQVIDGRVDLATAEIRDESSWTSLLQSLAYRERARELATAVAERVYRSDAVKQAIMGLAEGVGDEIGSSIELSTIDAAGPAQACVKAFLGPRYGDTVANAVEKDASDAFRVTPESGGAQIGTRSVVLESAGGLTGAVVLLVRRQLARMAQRLGQRMVGAVLGRIVSVAAGGVGLALIAKDIWDLRYGMLPIIADEMKSEETKSKVRKELATSIESQIASHVDTISAETSERILQIWRDFQSAHTKVLEIAEQDAEFRQFLDTVGEDRIQRLDEVVALLLAKDGENGVGRALRDGRLHTAVTKLDETAMAIARDRQSIDAGLKWSALAGDRLPEVIDLGLHQRGDPSEFSRSGLTRLLSLENRAAKLKLASLPGAERAILFELDADKLNTLGRSLSDTELGTLASYLRGLTPSASKTVLAAVAAAPAKMQTITSDGVRSAVLASRDQDAAVEMLLRDGNPLNPTLIGQDLQAVFDGHIAPSLIWEKHPAVVIAAAVLVLFILLILRSLLTGGRRRRPATAPDDGKQSRGRSAGETAT